MKNNDNSPLAAVLLIGDELLSGRTRDINLQTIAATLSRIGVDVAECRVVADVAEQIGDALNALRHNYDYVFTTGGIGPTHDDITVDAIAAAMGYAVEEHPEAIAKLRSRYSDEDLTPARRRMARAPKGSTLVANEVTIAPGFRIDNVFIMAGVPSVCKAMIEWVVSSNVIERGERVHERMVVTNHRESDIAPSLSAVQNQYAAVAIGSYPRMDDGKFSTRVILRSRNLDALEQAAQAVVTCLDELPPGAAVGGFPAIEPTPGGHVAVPVSTQ